MMTVFLRNLMFILTGMTGPMETAETVIIDRPEIDLETEVTMAGGEATTDSEIRMVRLGSLMIRLDMHLGQGLATLRCPYLSPLTQHSPMK
jgi:hypothetical protein